MNPRFSKARRQLLLATATGLLWTAGAEAAPDGRSVAVLYKRETTTAKLRLDAAVQSAVIALEQEMTSRGLAVVQPDASVYVLLDQGTGVPVTFAADAGFTVFFSAESAVRNSSAPGRVFTEIRLLGRLLLGRRVLASVRAEGRVEALLGSEASGYEFAAGRAARSFADQIYAALSTAVAAAQPPAPPAWQAPSDGTQPVDPGLPPGPTPSAMRPIRVPGEMLPRPTRVWGLLVGVSDFSHLARAGLSLRDLPPVRQDIDQMQRALIKLGGTPATVRVLAEAHATSPALRSALADLAARISPTDLVVVYISSHGLPKDGGTSGFGMPVLYDHDPARVQAALDFAEIQALIENLPTRQSLWIVDTCHAGGAAIGTRVIEIGGSPPTIRAVPAGTSFDANIARRDAATSKDFAVLSSSLPDQKALATYSSSVFTGILASGLESMQGGQSTVGQLFVDKVYAQVIDKSKTRQVPVMGVVGLGEYIRF